MLFSAEPSALHGGLAAGADSPGFASDAQDVCTETMWRSSPSRYFGHRII